MAEFVPFRGVLYNPKVIQHMDDVIAPPYDVISKQGQASLYNRHPNNIIRLILGREKQGDNLDNNAHSRAASYFKTWINEAVLIRDQAPAFYLTSVTFAAGGKTHTRYGVIGRVRLEPFDRGVILPHEKTFSKVKSERFELMKASGANFCSIFGIYSDARRTLATLGDAVREEAPDIDLIDDSGLLHKLWRITDMETLSFVSESLKEQKIFIADGHHRYETALNYRQWVMEQNPYNFSENHPANYVMMSLISMEDPGLMILPAHRLLQDVGDDVLETFMEKAAVYFDIYRFDNNDGFESAFREFETFLQSKTDCNAIGVYMKNNPTLFALVLKQTVMKDRYSNEMPEFLLSLDVTVLTRLVLMDLLGFDPSRLDDERIIFYDTRARKAIEAVGDGEADVVFILNPTQISQVREAAEGGHIMPRKSTYFYPKVISGLVINPLQD